MCLEIGFFQRRKVATEDIKVYKWMHRWIDGNGGYRYTTPYYSAEVIIGKTYTSNIKRYARTSIEKALHSYASLQALLKNQDFTGGRHAFTSIVECTIPKGSTYFKGTFMSSAAYASDALRYDRILTIEEIEQLCA